jgi:monothiol glutaredoxin
MADLPEDLKQRFEQEVNSNPVMLYMKGTPDFPMCGYSQRAAQCFQDLGVPVGHVNVLRDPEAWEGIKLYSDWPTIPQIFIGGEFIGGSSIVVEMLESGELEEKVKAAMAKSGETSATSA